MSTSFIPTRPQSMGHDPNYHRHQCETKIPYSSRAEARNAARKATSMGGPSMDVYECPFCGGFHLTRLSKAAQKTARKAMREELEREG